MHKDEDLLDMASDVDIQGYLLKDDASDDLLYAIKAVVRGEKYVSASLVSDPFESAKPCFPEDTPALTKREKEIIALVVEGLTSREIADKFFVSIKTIETHRTHIMEKLNLKGLVDMVRYAITNGLAKA